jgi:heme exporter protein C
MLTLANPAKFMSATNRLWRWLLWLTLAAFAIGLPLALVFSPPDYQQGEAVRMMYVHVPAAWMSMFTYAVMAVFAFSHLVWRAPLADLAAEAAAPMGAIFTAIALATGMLWGKPMWGAFWVWDARLTSVLVMFFIYLGVIALRQSIDDDAKAARLTAILTLIGAVNLPIIHFSVYWWNTLHQQATILRLGKPTIAGSMLAPLLVLWVAYMLLFATAMVLRLRTMIIRQRIKSASERQASRAEIREAGAHA